MACCHQSATTQCSCGMTDFSKVNSPHIFKKFRKNFFLWPSASDTFHPHNLRLTQHIVGCGDELCCPHGASRCFLLFHRRVVDFTCVDPEQKKCWVFSDFESSGSPVYITNDITNTPRGKGMIWRLLCRRSEDSERISGPVIRPRTREDHWGPKTPQQDTQSPDQCVRTHTHTHTHTPVPLTGLFESLLVSLFLSSCFTLCFRNSASSSW